MKKIEIEQGSPEWLTMRKEYDFTSSDAAVVMGQSPYKTIQQLLQEKSAGIEAGVDDYTEEVIFDKGHADEKTCRAQIEVENLIEIPPSCWGSDDGKLMTSLDGFDEEPREIWEVKQYSCEKEKFMDDGRIPPIDYWQCVHHLLVCNEAVKVNYCLASPDGTPRKTVTLTQKEAEQDKVRLLEYYALFMEDLVAYQESPLEEERTKQVAKPAKKFELPELTVKAKGMVEYSTLDEFRRKSLEVFDSVSMDLSTDQDFLDAKSAIKFCKNAEKKLKDAEQTVLGQMADVNAIINTLKEVAETARQTRLPLEKLVKTRQVSLKEEIVREYRGKASDFCGEHKDLAASFDPLELTKGLSSFDSMRGKLDAAYAEFRILTGKAVALRKAIREELSLISKEYNHLFRDETPFMACSSLDQVKLMIKGVVSEEEERFAKIKKEAEEAARLEAERKLQQQQEAHEAALKAETAKAKLETERKLREQQEAQGTEKVEPSWSRGPAEENGARGFNEKFAEAIETHDILKKALVILYDEARLPASTWRRIKERLLTEVLDAKD